MEFEQNFFNEKVYKKIKHKSGLTVIMNQMPQYNYTYAVLGVRFGSINIGFKNNKQNDFIRVPAGIAHFLEHKMFENEDGEDTFFKFAKTGAIANAYTGTNLTAYLFSCCDNFNLALEVLLDSLKKPSFSDESIKKELDIIKQEIKMYQDDPLWIGYFELLKSMYLKIPVFNDIAGTQQTIEDITKERLYQCYDAYYNWNNMVLSVAGNFDMETVIKIVEKKITERKAFKVVDETYDEPQSCVRKRYEMTMPIKRNILYIGFKHKPKKTMKENFLLNLKYLLINDMILGGTSNLFEKLYYQKMITKPINYEVTSGKDYIMSIFSLEVKEEQEVEKNIFEAIEEIKKQGISEAYLDEIKKSFYGKYIMDLDNPQEVASNHMEGFIYNCDFIDWYREIDKITKDELEILLRDGYKEDNLSVLVIKSKKLT